jgi:hypothetical protein
MDSLGSLRGTGQQRFWHNGALRPACLRRMGTVLGLRYSPWVHVVASKNREHPKRSDTGYGSSHVTFSSYLIMVHWNHWSTSYFWRYVSKSSLTIASY